MKKIILMMAIMIAVTSCKEKTERDIINDKFEEYVKSDFDDPDDFIEVTSIEPTDTLSKDKYIIPTIKLINEYRDLFSDYNNNLFDEYSKKFEKDNTFIVSYEVKVRIKVNDRKQVVTYYAIWDKTNNDLRISKSTLLMEDTPDIYQDFLKFMNSSSKRF